MKVLLIYPEFPTTFWSLKHAVRFAARRALLPPLGLLTVAALLPKEWDLRLVDLNVHSLQDEDLEWADYVLLSAMLIQRASAEEVARRCQRLGKPLICGGPMFSAMNQPTDLFPHLVQGEAEELMPTLIQDMRQHRLRPIYKANRFPDMTHSPIPRWDLIDLHQYTTMAVQFSRGCPFDCEFCDITVLNGRIPRTKTPQQVIAELEALRQAGWDSTVFLVDDNFIGNQKKVKELLREIIAWRNRTKTHITFLTEASLNLVDHPELIELMVEAGFKRVFVGIETPNPDSLKECGKVQNRRRNMLEAVHKLQESGLEVMGGFIVGFDHDPPDIFERQLQFIQSSGIGTAMVGLLTALPNTRLYRRLAQEGRLLRESSGNNTEASLNFIPKLDPDFLINGYRELMRKLYEPNTLYERLLTFLKHYRHRGPKSKLTSWDIKAFFRALWVLGVIDRGRKAFWKFFLHAIRRPREFAQAITQAIMGYHYRKVAESL